MILDHLWQSTLFAVIAGLLTLVLRRNPARVRFWVWFAASVKFLLPFALLTSLGSRLGWRVSPEAPPANIAAVILKAGEPFRAAPPVAALHASAPAIPLSEILIAAWMCGVVGVALSWWVRWRRVRAVVRGASQLAIPVSIPARTSSEFVEPAVFGIFRPVLLLPEGILSRLDPAQLQSVIAHELCHVRYGDNLIAAIQMVIETIFWFHPLIWWMGKRMVAERERSCDQEVLRMGNSPRVYAQGLLAVCSLCLESPLASVSGIGGASLKERIESILRGENAQPLTRIKKVALAAAAVSAFAIPVVLGVMDAPAVRAQSEGAARPKFEVASIKSCGEQSNRRKGGGESSPGRLSTGCTPLVGENNLGLVQRAYVRFAGGHLNPLGIIAIKGGPDWVRSASYEVDAKAEGHPSVEMMQGPMLQVLLENRFKLKIRREIVQGSVYDLVAVRNEPKLTPFQKGTCLQPPLVFPEPPPPPGERYCRGMVMMNPPGVRMEGGTMLEFTKLLNLFLDRPAIDKTGLSGRYTLKLEFAPDDTTPGLANPSADTGKANIFQAMQEQLGLKLLPAKGPIEQLVIEHIEKPSEN